MKIWVDADACPKAAKDILFRAAARKKTAVILVANSFLPKPPLHFILTVQVDKGFDAADNYIISHLKQDDLVITSDIPLAALVIEKKALALNPRGELYNENNINQRLSMRHITEQLRAGGMKTGGHSEYGLKDKAAFANALDRILAKIPA
jgi:uncharacterized protein YaiI (UPF0178 family)